MKTFCTGTPSLPLVDLKICQKRTVYWHVIGLGASPQVHSIFFEGHTFLVRHHRHATLDISPGTFLTAETLPMNTGTFEMFCQIPSHRQGNIRSGQERQESTRRFIRDGKAHEGVLYFPSLKHIEVGFDMSRTRKRTGVKKRNSISRPAFFTLGAPC